MEEKMEAKVSKEDCIKLLRKRVQEFKEKAAKDHTETEIKQKITDVFNGFNWKDESANESSFHSTLWVGLKVLKWILMILMVFVLLIIFVYLAGQYNPYVSNHLRATMHDRNMAYTIARFMRIVSLPFHEIFDLKKAQKWECLIQNPFYKSEEPNCELCELNQEVPVMAASDKEIKEISAFGEPCIVKYEPSFNKQSYNFTFIKEFYFQNKEDLDFSACELFGDGGSKTVEDYFLSTEDQVLKSKKTFGWKNCRIEGTRALRQLFKRPSFVPLMSEIYLEKHMFFINPESPQKLELPLCGTSNCFIAQVSGASSVTLTPFDACRKNCTNTEQFEIQTGDIFYYPEQPWKVTVEAKPNQLSIIYRSDFS